MTIHENVLIRPLMSGLARFIFFVTGWKTTGQAPRIPRYVIIAAPHTSNWDFIVTLCMAFIYRINPVIMMKDAWFRWPLGPIFRWLGAVPIDRSKANNAVGQMIEQFRQREKMILVMAPSGTRKRVRSWKTGFYHIANGAGVPIALGFVDYRRKLGGFGPLVHPTGDMDADMTTIRSFYRKVAGKPPLTAPGQPVAPQADPPATP